MTRPLRVLVFKDDGIFVAQALELDISAEGETEAEAAMRLNAAIAAEAAEAKARGRTLDDIGPAPDRFHAMYEFDVVSRTEIAA